jgi:hypothetical protein
LPSLLIRPVYGSWLVCDAKGDVQGAVIVGLLWVALAEGRGVDAPHPDGATERSVLDVVMAAGVTSYFSFFS